MKKTKTEGRHFSAFQILCVAGRTRDLCEELNIPFDSIKGKCVEKLNEMNKKGEASMDIIMEDIQQILDDFKRGHNDKTTQTI
jgi:hypothetical protein